jgi:hypothetical protein
MKRQPTRTPGTRFFLRQVWPSLRWQVVPVSEDQARTMQERSETVYASSAQAYAVARKLNRPREVKEDEQQ